MKESLLSIQTHSFSGRSLSHYPTLIEKILDVKAICTTANAESADISTEDARLILRSIDGLRGRPQHPFFAVDILQGGGGIAIHTAINEAICESLEEAHPTIMRSVKASQSTTDVLQTSFNLTLMERHREFSESLRKVGHTLDRVAETFCDLPVVSRTCMRRASTTTLGKLFEGYARPIQRFLESLAARSEGFCSVTLGGTAIGMGDGASDSYRSYVRKLLQDQYPELHWAPTLTDRVQNIDEWLAYSYELTNLANFFVKLAKDIRLISTEKESDFGAIQLPKVIAGSTFYQDKNNPTIPETLIQACFLAIGWNHAMGLAHSHGELQHNCFAPFVGVLLIDQITALKCAIENFERHCLNGVQLSGASPSLHRAGFF